MTLISYTEGVPNPPDNPSVDVRSMQANTNSIFQALAVDHGSFNADFTGFHIQSTYIANSTYPSTTLTNTGTVFSSESYWNNTPQLMYINGTNTSDIYQITNCYHNYYPSIGANPGWSFLPGQKSTSDTSPGGLLFNYGTATTVSGVITVSFPIPYNINPFSIVFGASKATGTVVLANLSSQNSTGFIANVYQTQRSGGGTWNSPPDGTVINWMAIGV